MVTRMKSACKQRR